jgi:hypothetical protein
MEYKKDKINIEISKYERKRYSLKCSPTHTGWLI